MSAVNVILVFLHFGFDDGTLVKLHQFLVICLPFTSQSISFELRLKYDWYLSRLDFGREMTINIIFIILY